MGLFCSVPAALLIMFIVIPLAALTWRGEPTQLSGPV